MEQLLDFVTQMPLWMKAGWVAICIGIFWILEGNYAQFAFSYRKWRHAQVNLLLLVGVMLINAVFGLATAGLFIWLDNNGYGLLQSLELPVWAELLIALLVLDLLAQYYVHYLLHKIPWMWRLHLVHHSDKEVDVTTGTRHHPLDFIIRECFALVAVLITGMPLAFYLLYRLLSVLFTYWTHANLKLPLPLDRALSLVIVTPNMHKFHHHYRVPWTDSNYGNMFSIWDRIFGTFVYGNLEEIKYGVDIADHTDDQDIATQLGLPFNHNVDSSGFRKEQP